MSNLDLDPLWLTLKLAVVTTWLLLLVSLPLAWWLAHGTSRLRPVVSVLVAMPLVLPPTVLGFYLLLFLSPQGLGGTLTQSLGLGTLPFTFLGLVIASAIYSLPFAVQPLQSAFSNIGKTHMDAAATLGAGPWDQFFSIILPLARSGIMTSIVLSFAHTMGEFGVILMIGGNIPGETRVLSMAIYDHVESMEYMQAHILAGCMLAFAFVVLLLLQLLNRQSYTLNNTT